MSPPAEATYEMLWDCKFCGQKKNLGLTHRNCGNCGGPQDPERRYFPADDEKVAVNAHPFVGADLACSSCGALMSRNVKCCTKCGAPVGAGKDIKLRDDVVVPDPGAAPLPAPGMNAGPGAPGAAAPKGGSSGLLIGGLVAVGVVIVLGLLIALLWKREGMFVVTGRSWQRSVEVQRMEETRTSAWCDSPPSGGHELSRHKESRGTTKVQDGETCQTRKKDQGNGTYKEVRECTPKYKDVPVSADRCDYDVMTWTTARTPKEQGAEDAPRWPQVSLGRTGTAVGSEREGARSEKYTVSFTEEKTGKPASCDVAQPAWATFTKGAKYKGKVRVATGGLDCDALVK